MIGNDEKIQGEHIYLRKLTEDDASDAYASWLNDKEVNEFLETRWATARELREYIVKHRADPNSFFAGVFDRSNDCHIGNVKLEPIDWKNKKAIFGILIGDKSYWGKGYGTEATYLITDFAFNTLNLHEVQLGVIANNTRALHVYEKIGFMTTDVRKATINHGGVLLDEVVMQLKKK